MLVLPLSDNGGQAEKSERAADTSHSFHFLNAEIRFSVLGADRAGWGSKCGNLRGFESFPEFC